MSRLRSFPVVLFLTLLPLAAAAQSVRPNAPQVTFASINKSIVFASAMPGATTAAQVQYAINTTLPPAQIVITPDMPGTPGDFTGIIIQNPQLALIDMRGGQYIYALQQAGTTNFLAIETLGPPAGNLNATLLDQGGAVFNVKAKTYGAIGDGVADDTNGINSTIAAARANGGIVFFPAGTYNHTGISIQTGRAVILRGAGIASTKLALTANSGTAVELNWGFSNGSNWGGGLEDMEINCNPATGTRTGVQFGHPAKGAAGTIGSWLKQVRVTGCTEGLAWGDNSFAQRIEHSTIDGNTQAVYMPCGTDDPTCAVGNAYTGSGENIKFEDNIIGNCSTIANGIYVNLRASDIGFHANSMDNCAFGGGFGSITWEGGRWENPGLASYDMATMNNNGGVLYIKGLTVYQDMTSGAPSRVISTTGGSVIIDSIIGCAASAVANIVAAVSGSPFVEVRTVARENCAAAIGATAATTGTINGLTEFLGGGNGGGANGNFTAPFAIGFSGNRCLVAYSGSGAPSSTCGTCPYGNGSQYFRTDGASGTLRYACIGTTWTALAGN